MLSFKKKRYFKRVFSTLSLGIDNARLLATDVPNSYFVFRDGFLQNCKSFLIGEVEDTHNGTCLYYWN